MARALAATMPSGDALIVKLRLELAAIIGVPDSLPTVPATWETSVFDAATLQRPWPLHYIYVGHGPSGSGFNPSPWGSHFHHQYYQPVVLMTADLYSMLVTVLTSYIGCDL